ncbi:hypothetical protein ABIF63_010255 [Bradyrhizobium japonicum]|uniref:DUF4760 domain-containing protein n=1 Tax=Bradyrhizobium japonicum TaxID=375 RepID=A0ABV2SAE6_BRAJP|nr:hypothetical protein [Bradyrhizobium japonicum]UQD99944.1 hypothetical protein JEY30_06625 [Bradyrhizobium japonicum]WLB19961.1 hypothetical protein QIH95_03015 [Bradyrhizobium japonicum]
MAIAPGNWSWLEIAKLAVSLTGPIVALVVGIWIKQVVDRIEQRRWETQNTIKWRLSVFERLAPKLNLLYSAFSYVGRWKELAPPDLINLKRDLDEIVFTYEFLWSKEFREKYQALMEACFELNQGPGKSAKIAANVEMYRAAHSNWDPRWDDMFVPVEQRSKRADIQRLVDAVLRTAIDDLGLNLHQK